MMVILGKYKELAPGMGFESMKNHFENGPYRGKDKILNYLKNGSVHMVTARLVNDVFTGETVDIELSCMDDGHYSWTSSLIYYVDKYNLRLPIEFERHVLG